MYVVPKYFAEHTLHKNSSEMHGIAFNNLEKKSKSEEENTLIFLCDSLKDFLPLTHPAVTSFQI